MRGICQNVGTDTTGRVISQKMLGKILTERDWSAQELCHNLMWCNMTSVSREFGTIYLLEDRLGSQGKEAATLGKLEFLQIMRCKSSRDRLSIRSLYILNLHLPESSVSVRQSSNYLMHSKFLAVSEKTGLQVEYIG